MPGSYPLEGTWTLAAALFSWGLCESGSQGLTALSFFSIMKVVVLSLLLGEASIW